VDFYLSETRDREAAKRFLSKALTNPDNRPPHVFARDGLRSYPAAIRELKAEGKIRSTCRQRTRRYANNRVESDHRHVKRRLRTMHWPRTTTTAAAVIQGIESSEHDQERTSSRNHPPQPAWASVGVRCSSGRCLIHIDTVSRSDSGCSSADATHSGVVIGGIEFAQRSRRDSTTCGASAVFRQAMARCGKRPWQRNHCRPIQKEQCHCPTGSSGDCKRSPFTDNGHFPVVARGSDYAYAVRSPALVLARPT
jgi:DDE domain